MQDALIRLFSAVHVESVKATRPVDFQMVAALNAEVGTFGYTFDERLMDAIGGLSADRFAAFRTDLLDLLGKISGAQANHAVLFNKFPYSTPDQHQYLMSRMLGYLENDLRLIADHWQMLSCGHVIDPGLFNLTDFGACPICQRQVNDSGLITLFAKVESPDYEKYPFERITPLKRLTLADDALLTTKGNLLLGRQSSLSADERSFLTEVKDRVTLTIPATLYRENLPFVFSIAYQARSPSIASLLSGVTDVLRIAIYLSDNTADLSLTTNARFKLSTAEKKAMFRLLESFVSDIAPDMMRHRERWLRLGEHLQPQAIKNAAKYPKTADAFDRLRNAPGKIVTFNKVFEQKIRARVIDTELVTMMQTRPGEFIRHLDVMIRDANDPSIVLDGLASIAPKITTRMLFDIQKYLSFRDNRSPTRVFIPKGPANRVRTIEDHRNPIATDVLIEAIQHLQRAMTKRFKLLPAMGKVYIHPSLNRMLLPFNQRGDSSASMSVVKGSCYPLSDAEVLRLFVHWTGYDVDLSIVYYDTNLTHLDFVSYRNTQEPGIVHSGDIQRAPNGASEFIDIHVPTLLDKRVRYVICSVISYSGESFDEFPCFVGFMERDGLRSGQRFEPASVAIKMDLSAKATSMIPFMFDLEDRTVIYLDMISGKARSHSYVDASDKSFAEVAQAIMSLPDRKPTIGDVLDAHARARGTLVDDPTQADIVFMPDVNVDDIAKDYVA